MSVPGDAWRRRRGVLAVLAALLVGVAPVTSAAEQGRAPVPTPSVTGPITGGLKGRPFGSPPFDMAALEVPYVEEEYFLSGTARAYDLSPTFIPLGAASPLPSAPYLTRVVVRRPADATAFNGVVHLEWLNVTSGYDVDADWAHSHEEILRGGYAYAGVTAQVVGVNGLKAYDPVRYSGLVHPGDAYSYDIFAQTAQAVRRATAVMGGFDVGWVVASGSSQSGTTVNTYVNVVDPQVERVIDGFLIVVSGGSVRDDLDVPVLRLLSEAEAGGGADDSEFYRHWEVAGASHSDSQHSRYWSRTHDRDWGTLPGTWPLTPRDRPGVAGVGECLMGRLPRYDADKAALHHLARWVRGEGAPPRASRIVLDDGDIGRDPATGNALGGIRLPAIEVPLATYLGEGDDCAPTFGRTIPFDDASLAARYPAHGAYVDAVRNAVGRAVAAGFLLPPDGERIVAEAAASRIGT